MRRHQNEDTFRNPNNQSISVFYKHLSQAKIASNPAQIITAFHEHYGISKGFPRKLHIQPHHMDTALRISYRIASTIPTTPQLPEISAESAHLSQALASIPPYLRAAQSECLPLTCVTWVLHLKITATTPASSAATPTLPFRPGAAAISSPPGNTGSCHPQCTCVTIVTQLQYVVI